MSCEARDDGLLRHALDNAEFVDIFVSNGDFLGVSLRACTASKKFRTLEKRFDVQEGWVRLDVMDIQIGGAVERHNRKDGSLKIRPKDQVISR